MSWDVPPTQITEMPNGRCRGPVCINFGDACVSDCAVKDIIEDAARDRRTHGNRPMCQAVGNQEPTGTDRNRQELTGMRFLQG